MATDEMSFHGLGSDPEALELESRLQWWMTRLWSSAVVFFFVSFLFAYLYLKSLNVNGMWHPANETPPTALGTIAIVAVLLAMVVHAAAARRVRSAGAAGYVGPAALALVLLLVASVVEIWQLPALGFGFGDSAYASVFVGWTWWTIPFWLGSTYWLETLVARAARGKSEATIAEELGPRADAFQFSWYILVGAAVVQYVLLFLVK